MHKEEYQEWAAVVQAVANVNEKIAPALIAKGLDVTDQKTVDDHADRAPVEWRAERRSRGRSRESGGTQIVHAE